MGKEAEFEKWFESKKFKYFSAREFIPYFKRTLNTIPPKSKWENIVPTLRVLDKLREEIKQPIRVTSSYRSDKYNKKVGGASKSQHKEFTAIDFQVDGANPCWLVGRLRRLRRLGEFEGGIGEYKTFVHVDTRGTNADW